MAHLSASVPTFQQAISHGCPAQVLGPSQRMTLGLQALAGRDTVTDLADELDVSRKFVYRQAAIAQSALDEAFTTPTTADDQVLFHLPVTKNWLRQVALGLTLICHSSYRGVHEFCRDLIGVSVSVGTVHNIVRDAVTKARPYNHSQDLANIRVAGLDEIFQHRRPVLVGADIASTYCFLLSHEEHRDADTWAVRLLEARDRGFAPQATIADFGAGLRAGQKQALPGTECRGDVFHALHDLVAVANSLDRRAYNAIVACDRLEHKKTKRQRQARRDQVGQVRALARKASAAAAEQTQAIRLADDVTLLMRWLRDDVFAVSGLPSADRRDLFDFVVAELQTRQPLCPHRLEPVATLLQHHRDQLLAFAAQLDRDLAALAADFEVPLATVRELLDLHALDPRQPRRWQQETRLRQQLRDRFYHLDQALRDITQRVVRASSVIENINSRLRNYFFLRRHLGGDYLALLQFFLNHRRFLRSEHPERVGQSPAELLTGTAHPHWLAMLGYTPVPHN